MTHICPYCGREFKEAGGLGRHMSSREFHGFCSKSQVRSGDPVTDEEDERLNALSDRNVLIQCGGNLRELTDGQIKALKRRGIISGIWGGFTERGLKLLAEIELEAP